MRPNMEETYEKDKIKIREKAGKVTCYNPGKKTHICEYARSPH